MDVFRLRETKDIMSIQELKEKCDTVNMLTDVLEVRNYHAVVCKMLYGNLITEKLTRS